MNMKTLLALVAVFGMAGSAIAQGDAERGEELSQTCAGCHGTDGNSAAPSNPKLAGQNERYIVEQLQAYRDGDRIDPMMQGFASNLTDEDMQDLAAFYSEQEPTFGEADPDMVELGRQIYRAGIAESEVMSCMGCHGPRGQGNAPAGFPALSGQHADYTLTQLEAYREGYRTDEASSDARTTDGQARMMRSVAYRLRDFEMEAVASYIQGLH